jgi:CheY-like chemotaxis protein
MMHALLDASRAIAGGISLSRRAVDLSALVRHVDETLSLTGESRERPLVLQLAGEAWVDADPARLEQIVSQLLIHVAKCTPPGEAIEVRTQADGPHVTFHVRSKAVPSRPVGTPGIEWTLARALVQLHGGELTAGTAGEFNDVAARFTSIAAPEAEDGRSLPPLRRRKVLLLQRDSGRRQALQANLELDGHTVAVAASEAEAFSRVAELKPDVAIVALETPGPNAFEFAKRIRAAGFAGRMIALATERSEGAVRNARAAGFDELVTGAIDLDSTR